MSFAIADRSIRALVREHVPHETAQQHRKLELGGASDKFNRMYDI